MSGASDELFTSLGSLGLEPQGQIHINDGWKELHSKAIELNEATLTADGVLLATTGERTGRSPNDRFIVKESGLAD